MAEYALPFEKALFELEERLAQTHNNENKQHLEHRHAVLRKTTYRDITPWQRIQLARHPRRPRMLDYTSRILDDFIELHGDRLSGDDPAMVCGIGRIEEQTVFVVGHQKGVDTDEKVRRNFGMAHPSGYRKALRIYRMAERLGYPIISFVDTPAAHPGIEAEEGGQGYAIAESLLVSSELKTPILAVVLSEGGSGGALAVAMADRVVMFEYAVYMICPPERCAEILWRDVTKKDAAAAALRVSAADLLELNVIDAILPEPDGPAHRNPDAAAAVLKRELLSFLADRKKGIWTPQQRQARFQRMGQWQESP